MFKILIDTIEIVYQMLYNENGVIDMQKESKNELIHIRIEPTVKEKSEEIFKKLGINMSYAVSLFLNQVILKNGFPFNVELPQINETEVEKLSKVIESTGGNGKVSEDNQKIIHLYATNQIDYETAVLLIKRNFTK